MDGSGMKEKILEKILEMFAQLPDSDEAAQPKEGAELQIVGVDAKPIGKDDEKVC